MSFDNLIDTYIDRTPEADGSYAFPLSTIPFISAVGVEQQVAVQWNPPTLTNLNTGEIVSVTGLIPSVAAVAAIVPEEVVFVDPVSMYAQVDTTALQATTFVGADGDTYQRTALLTPSPSNPVLVMRDTPMMSRMTTFQPGSAISGVIDLSAV